MPRTISDDVGLIESTTVSPTPSQDSITSLIYTTAKNYHIDPELLLRIAKCESGLHPNAKNPKSTASGIFQFLDGTFFNQAQAYELPTDNKNDPTVQIELAVRMIADGKIGAWNSSRSCWSR